MSTRLSRSLLPQPTSAPAHPPTPTRTPAPLRALFLAIALAFAAASLFHGAALLSPSLAEPSPAWRHALFVAINLAVAAGFLIRPRWFAFVFLALTLQQLYSHGSQALWLLTRDNRLDWASLLVLAAMPPVAWLLLRDRARGREHNW